MRLFRPAGAPGSPAGDTLGHCRCKPLSARNRLRGSFYQAVFRPGRQKDGPAGPHQPRGLRRRKPGRFWPNLPRTPDWCARYEACTLCIRSAHRLSARVFPRFRQPSAPAPLPQVLGGYIPSPGYLRSCNPRRSTAAAPNSRQAYGPYCPESIFPTCKKPFDPVPYLRGYNLLCHGSQIDNGAASFDYCYLVCVAAEPGAFLGKVVGHDEIEVLSDQFVFGVFEKVFGLRGKSNQHLSRRLNLSKGGENVRIGLEEDPQCFLRFL